MNTTQRQLIVLYSFLAATYSSVCTPYSTIGAVGLNFRVRHGTGCDPDAIATRKPIPLPYVSRKFTENKNFKEKKASMH